MTKEESAKLAYDALTTMIRKAIPLDELTLFHKLQDIRTNLVNKACERKCYFLT